MEIDADFNFQRRFWVAQRVGWFFFALLIIAALVGFFGTGPMSRASAQGPGLRIEYERFARLQQPTKIRFVLYEARSASQIELSGGYFDAVQIEQITPLPSAVESAGDRLVYRFTGPSPLSVTFHLKPEEFGSLAGAAKISGGNAVPFRQFVYP
ncbi:MAG: hypothetical protein ACREP3_03810 [Candidatus Binatia bacterium]